MIKTEQLKIELNDKKASKNDLKNIGVDNMNTNELKEFKNDLRTKIELDLKNNKKINNKSYKLEKRNIILNIIHSLTDNKTITLLLDKNYENKIITKSIYEKELKELYFTNFKNNYDIKNIIEVNTRLPNSNIPNRAFILDNKNEISLFSYNNLILKFNKQNKKLYLATKFIATPKSVYDNNKSYKKSSTYDIIDKNGIIDLTLICSVTTSQHINAYLDYYKPFNKYHNRYKGATKFIRLLTNTLTLKELNKINKIGVNELIEVATLKNDKLELLYGVNQND